MRSTCLAIVLIRSRIWAFDWYQNRWPWTTSNGETFAISSSDEFLFDLVSKRLDGCLYWIPQMNVCNTVFHYIHCSWYIRQLIARVHLLINNCTNIQLHGIQPNIGFTLRRVLAVFTRSALRRKRTDLDDIWSLLSILSGAGLGQFLAQSAQ